VKRNKIQLIFLTIIGALLLGCDPSSSTSQSSINSDSQTTSQTDSSTSSTTQSSIPISGSSSYTPPIWDGNSIHYGAYDIRGFGSGTPAGVANYEDSNDTVVIWNIDASLDNYGGVQTPRLSLDFSKAVIFEMNVVSSYSQYIVKLAVEGESEYYYVLSDEGTPGLISINVVDAMLSQKYREKNTQPDPGYNTGWKYDNQIKNCAFHILAKGPDGERQTAELVLTHIAIYNNQPAVTGIFINSPDIVSGKIEKLKGSPSIALTSSITPSEITDKSVLWASSDDTIATISETGVLSFVGVGTAYIIAKSRIDQSKQAILPINVLSGYENPSDLKTELTSLSYAGSSADVDRFADLFKTTWGTNIKQTISIETMVAIDDHRRSNGDIIIENYFNPATSGHVTEANARLSSGTAAASLTLTGTALANVYRNIDGQLYSQSYSGTLRVDYAQNSPAWSRLDDYVEETIVVWNSGAVYKYRLRVINTTLLGENRPSDFMNSSLWTIPDRTRQTEDAVIHALSPASLRIESSQLVMKQNKYPEAKYCFGGIVSNVFNANDAEAVQMLLNITALNQMNDFVKTMWEIKVLYYGSNGTTVISSNPLKIDSGNTIGQHTITFIPAYSNFRLYLVVNGSDIGAQFADAEMRLDLLKIYTID